MDFQKQSSHFSQFFKPAKLSSHAKLFLFSKDLHDYWHLGSFLAKCMWSCTINVRFISSPPLLQRASELRA